MAAGKKKRRPSVPGKGPSEAKLDKMIEEAIVDAYGESHSSLAGTDWIAAFRRWARGGR